MARTRVQNHKLEEFMRKHSPIKEGLVRVKNEDVPFQKYNKILPRLYIGNFQAAKDREFFKTKNIKAVLNCTKELDNQFANNREIEYMRIPVDDSLKERDFSLMLEYLPVIVAYIHKHVDIQKNTLLSHCVGGRQRSVISVCAYLVTHHNMTPQQACKFVVDKRPEAFHFGKSLNFSSTLNKYYKELESKK